jgi:hypothetical protein
MTENEKLMRRLLEFYAQDNLKDGCSGYDSSWTRDENGMLVKTWEGSVLEDAGRKAQLLLLDLYGDTGMWKDEATARERLKGVSYTHFDEAHDIYTVTQTDAESHEWTGTRVFGSQEAVLKFINDAIAEANEADGQERKEMKWPAHSSQWNREVDGYVYHVASHDVEEG